MTDPRPHVLVVDDDRAHREMLRTVLAELGAEVDCAEDGEQALALLARTAPALVLLDMRMPKLDGLGTLRGMQQRGLLAPTIVLTAHADLDEAVQAMKLGAADYLRKPIDIENLQALLQQHLGTGRREAAEGPPLPPDVVVASPLMQEVCRDLARIAASDAAVLLAGETGTGKEVFANLLHRWSARAAGPLVSVNVAALPEGLVESELFGHEKGAFTGAAAARIGQLQAASGGTLFLDEVGEMPLLMQPKLLRALQSRTVTPLGSRTEREVDFRLVTATNRDLEAEVQAGRFRQDLYYRIAVITVEIPPLRERPEDVLPLAQRCLQQHGHKRLSPAAAARLVAYGWPGNVRELENTMLRAAILAPGDVVLPENLPPNLLAGPLRGPTDARSLAEIERQAILAELERTGGNRSEAARRLGISRRKLLYRLKDYRVDGAP
ncbi:MAG: sigma-54-dependent Fis family transcriptional regulator [Planctomycetes bacterium]|nr:sigma-54-dependent Fis family transcriptional regulator [Planctomycetota bacterium]